jgi:hypothetical protein
MTFEVSCNADQYDATPAMASDALRRAIDNRLRLERLRLASLREVREERDGELRVVCKFTGAPE